MDRDKIIDKICKCMRLSESCNPNEAAMAIRQARSMMKKYGISESQVLTSGVTEATVDSGIDYKPPFWVLALANIVGQAFGCRPFLTRKEGANRHFRFIGVGHYPQVCSYTFEVLHRRLRRARKDFVWELEVETKKEKTRRGDVFAQAWLFRIAQLVAEFSSTPEAMQAVDEYVKQNYGEAADLNTKPKGMENPDYEDILSGMRAANEVDLHRPVSEQKRYHLAK
ncbi:MAG: DUF2786 domain-containing protein [Gammaproteobacteria bacterium]|nr:DUF2786 domain-containing protein [Gammaproteobacteria bacterium]